MVTFKIISFAGKKNVAKTVAAMIVGAIAEVLGIGIIVTLAMKAINDNGIAVHAFGLAVQLTKFESLAAALCIFILRCVVYNATSNVQVRFSFLLHKKLSVTIYKKILENKEYITKITSGKFVQETITELHNYRDMYVVPLITIISELIVAAALVIVIGFISIEIVALIIIAFFCIVLASKFLNKNLNRLGNIRKKIEQERIDLVKNTKSGSCEILIYNQTDRYATEFGKLTNSVGDVGTAHAYGIHKLRSIQELILVVAILMIIGGGLGSAQSVLILFMLMRLIPSSTRVNTAMQSILYTKNINEDVVRLLNNEAQSKTPMQNKSNGLSDAFSGQIFLDRKSIVYKKFPSYSKPGFFCIVGKSGVGKSQLGLGIVGIKAIWSICGFKRISIIDEMEVGFVPQESYIESGTINQNIVFGREIDEKRLVEVKKLSNINFSDDKIGLQLVSSDTLSGGQKKRISIARALYGLPKYLILDEPTNNLDVETVDRLIETINKLRDRIVLICITHDERLINFSNDTFHVEASIVEK